MSVNPLEHDSILKLSGPTVSNAPEGDAVSSTSSEPSFKDLLSGLVDKVDALQKDADTSIKSLVTGETQDLHNVTIKMEEAGVAFDLMMEIRNKLLEAYQEILRMQA